MNRIDYKDNIIAFENFLSKEECDAIIKYWEHSENNGNLGWQKIGFYGSSAANLPVGDDMVDFGLPIDLVESLSSRMQETANIARGGLGLRPVGVPHAQIWVTGGFTNPHSDNSTDGDYNEFERSKWATFIYLNDDFEGGELYFPAHNISIKPKAGLIAAFDGGHTNQHEVRLITSGKRFTIGQFWDYTESEYNQEKINEWEKRVQLTRSQQAEQLKGWEEAESKGEKVLPSYLESIKGTQE
jgi:hypothetical protein